MYTYDKEPILTSVGTDPSPLPTASAIALVCSGFIQKIKFKQYTPDIYIYTYVRSRF